MWGHPIGCPHPDAQLFSSAMIFIDCSAPVCGKCKIPLKTQELFAPQPLMVTESDFQALMRDDRGVLVDLKGLFRGQIHHLTYWSL